MDLDAILETFDSKMDMETIEMMTEMIVIKTKRKEEKNMKNKNLKKVMKMIGTGVYVNVWMMCSNTIAVMADPVSTGVAEVDTILTTLKTLFLGLVAGIGLIILIKGIADTAQAYQQQDSHGMYDGAKGIAAGAIMTFAGSILTLMGIS